MNLKTLNALGAEEAAEIFRNTCNAERWVQRMIVSRPFESPDQLIQKATAEWSKMAEADWLEAFDGHPKIGDPASLKAKYRATLTMASHEQSGVETAGDAVINQLAEANEAYLDKFGFIFIVCATGKSAEQMLEILLGRIENSRQQELEIAAAEQGKITLIRLNALLT